MASTTQVHSYHGADPGTPADVTGITIRHKRNDNDTQDLNNPIPIPAAGSTNYGWRKHTKLNYQTGPNQKVENLRWFADADPDSSWTGVTLLAGTIDTYTQGTSSDESTALGNTADSDGYTSGSPLQVQIGIVADSQDSFPTVGAQDFVRSQLEVAATASPGGITARQTRYRWDEI